MLVSINKNVNLGELITQFRQCIKWIGENNDGCFVSFSGWHEDTRELCEIPEVVNLCQSLVKLGFITVLATSTSMPDVKEEMEKRFNTPLPFGALEIWGIAKKIWEITEEGSKMILTKEICQQFLNDLKPNLFLNKGPNTNLTGKTIFRKPL